MSEMNESKPRTWFAGDSSPEDQKKSRETGIIALGLFILAFPVAAIAFAIQFSLFSLARVSHKVLFAIAALYGIFLIATGLIVNATKKYLSSFRDAASGISDGDGWLSVALKLLIDQAPISILIGGVAGATYAWWRYFRRPAWERVSFRRTPIEFYRRKNNIKNIEADKKSPENGMTLGINDHTGRKVVQTFKAATAHTFVVGGSGTGKTVTMLTRARDVIQQGRAYVMLDLKGSRPLADDLYELAQRYNRPFYHFSVASPRDENASPDPNGLAFYEPIYKGDASRRKDLILSLRSTWTEEHYEILASQYLQTAMNVAIANPPEDTTDAMLDIIRLLDPQVLSIRAQGIPSDYPDANRIKEAAQQLSGSSRKETSDSVSGTRGIVSGLRDSTVGYWLRSANREEGEREINLYDAANEGAVVLFTIDTSTYEKVGKQIANLVIQDMKTVSAEMRLNPTAHPLHFDIDEFSSLDGDHVINLINKCRDADIPVTLTTQALGDLAKISPNFKDQLLGIIANFIIHRANTDEDAKIYAGLTGTGEKWDMRYSVEQTSGGLLGGMGKGAATGSGMVNKVEDTKVPFGDIMKLEQGQVIYVCKSPNILEHIRVIKEDGLSVPSGIGASSYAPRIAQPQITASLPPDLLAERQSAPQISPIVQPQIEAGRTLPEDLLAPTDTPTRKSSGFVDGVDLNAAMYGSSFNTTAEPPTTPVAPNPPATTTPEPSPTPRLTSSSLPPRTNLPTPPMRPQRPQSTSGGLPTRPNSLPTNPVSQRPPSSKTPPIPKKPTSAKKPEPSDREFTEEW